VPDSPADCLRGHGLPAFLTRDLLRDLFVGGGLSEGDREQESPHCFLKFRAIQGQGRSKARIFPAEIYRKPAVRFRKNRKFSGVVFGRERAPEVFLTVEPQAGQALPVAGESNSAERRSIVMDTGHLFVPFYMIIFVIVIGRGRLLSFPRT
jgi:hypothetical protein